MSSLKLVQWNHLLVQLWILSPVTKHPQSPFHLPQMPFFVLIMHRTCCQPMPFMC